MQILTGRTDKRQMGSRAGNSFSVARFAVAEEDALVPQQQKKEKGRKCVCMCVCNVRKD